MHVPRAHLPLFVFAAFLSSNPLPAQTAAPQAYTVEVASRITLESMFSPSPSLITVNRNGAREMTDVVLAPAPGQKEGVHIRRWFDLKTKRVYTQDLLHSSCSWMNYTASGMAPNYDPMALPPPTADEIAKLSLPATPKGMLAGVYAHVVDREQDGVKSRVWIADQGHFIIKAQMPGPDGMPMVAFEVHSVKLAPPADALLVPPSGCTTKTEGVWNDDGIQASGSTTIDATASGSANVKTGKSTGSGTVKQTNQPH
ncbi:MAG: hypothetical protein WCE75_09980 [Terracidiphilus sp.]